MTDVIEICCMIFPFPHLALLETLQHNFSGPKYFYLF